MRWVDIKEISGKNVKIKNKIDFLICDIKMMNGVRACSDYKLSSLEFMRDSYLKDKNVGVLKIGRGQKFNDEYQNNMLIFG